MLVSTIEKRDNLIKNIRSREYVWEIPTKFLPVKLRSVMILVVS